MANALEGRRSGCEYVEKSGEGDVAVKGSDHPRNAAQFSYRLARERWKGVHVAA